jgi:hypothetical protein
MAKKKVTGKTAKRKTAIAMITNPPPDQKPGQKHHNSMGRGRVPPPTF